MYNVYNKSNVFYVSNNNGLHLIGNEKDLIRYIAKFYQLGYWGFWNRPEKPPVEHHLSNKVFENFTCNDNELDKAFQFFDGYGRCINPLVYKQDAYDYYSRYLFKKEFRYFWKSAENIGKYRYDPVPYTSKRRGGPWTRPRKIKHISKMYSNPEYKEFNRGSRSDYPDGWWDDWHRCRQRSWKKQSKRKHQWKESD